MRLHTPTLSSALAGLLPPPSSFLSMLRGAVALLLLSSGALQATMQPGATWTAQDSGILEWTSITSSADGSKLAAACSGESGGEIYTSTDSGVTWTARDSNHGWASITSSADGRKLAAVESGGKIYTSTDYGANWTARDSNRSWQSITSSANGSKLAAVALSMTNGQIYTSTDSGETWTARMTDSNRLWTSITSSADGSKLAAVVSGGKIYTSTDSGETWTARDSNRPWQSITSSADGSKLAAAVTQNGQIYTSTDYGVTWTAQNSGNGDWNSITSSADGVKLAAVVNGGQIYTSSNGGETWTNENNSGIGSWVSITSSADGSKLAATEYFGEIYTLTSAPAVTNPTVTSISPTSGSTAGGTAVTITGNYFTGATGVTMGGVAATNVVVVNATTITCTAPAGTVGTASVVVTTAGGSNAANTLYTYTINTAPSFALPPSSPAGVTWTAQTSGSPRWWSITSSADGSKLAAVVQGGQIYTSTDYGVTWTAQNSGSRQWQSITSSADGSKLAAVVNNGQIYTSTDYGVNWTARDSERAWYSITSSADGSKLAAVVTNGQIYTSTNSGVTWTARESGSRNWYSITSSADGLKLAAVDYDGTNAAIGGQIYTSSNGGETWTNENNSGIRRWKSITSSADGSKLAAMAAPGQIYTSTDYGVTWTARESGSLAWESITSSADGSKLAAVAYNGQVYTSTDSGANWTARDSGSRRWTSITSSADGSKLAAVEYFGQIYTSGTLPYNKSVAAGSGPSSTAEFASSISKGPPADADQTVTFTVTNNNNGLFTTQPAIASNGTLTFTPGEEEGVATVTVTAVDNGGTAGGGVNTSAAQTFTITVTPPAPTITSLNITAGTILGGTSVTITGNYFTGATGVTIGGTAATNVVVVNATTITCTAPAGTLGTASVVVTTAGGSNAVNTLYTYTINTAPSFALPPGSWTARMTDSTRYWQSITSSADGIKLAAVVYGGQIYTSTDSGATWAARASGSRSWNSITSSADGSKLATVVLGGQIYTSTDFGVNWTARMTDSTRNWRSITSSADGIKLAAVMQNGQIYTSTNSGATWVARESERNWYSITSSEDGSKLAAVDRFGQIYTSTDSGATWVARESERAWLSITSSADGSKLAAVVNGGYIYTSTDSGVNWTARMTDSNRGWNTITSSADGSKLAAVVFGGQIYTSTDSGVTWTARESNRPWSSITSSADGSKLAAMVQNGQIYTPNPYNVSVAAGSGLSSTAAFASSISAGPPADADQTVSFTVTNNNNSLFTTQPAIASNGTLTFTPGEEEGVATVTVTAVDNGGTAGDGVDTSAEQTFTITVTPGKPELASINPTIGSSAGGTKVTLTGTRFTGATGVTIGGVAATNVVAVNDTTVTCTTPAGAPGTASVVVTTPLGTNAANTLYTYLTPEITIQGKGVEIASGDTTPSVGDDTDFGSADITGGTVVRTFTIGNSGNDALVLTGTPKVSLTGASEFSVTTQPTSPVALEGEPKTFAISFAPTSFGTKNAVVTIASDDLDEASYTFAITGSGSVPPGPAVTYNYDIPKLSYTTGCLEHIVRLTNKAQGPIGGVRLTVTNLPPGYVMYNATDKGLPPSIVVYKAIAPESAVEIRVQYYSTSRTIVGWTPTYTLEPVLPVTITGESFVPALGGTTSFNVKANSPWKVSLSQKWASVSSPTSGDGNGSFTVTVQPFTSAKPAQRTLLIKIPGAEDFLLTQTGVDKPELGQMQASYNTVVGADYELAVPTQNAPVTYTATGLPTGLKLGTDGWITGTPTKDGSFNVKVSARNAAGSAAPVSFIINVAKLDVAVVGAYHGYMERSSSVVFGPAANLGASFLMTTTATGAVTGKLTEGGTTKSFEGKLTVIDSQPRSYAFSTLIKGTGNTLAVTFDTVSSTLEGSVTSESNSGTASRSRASVRGISQGALVQAWRAADNATAYAGRHNFTITSPPTSNPTFLSNGPAGYGYGSLTVNAASRVITIAGKLADGSALTGTTVAGSGSPMKVLVYQSLYGNRGSIFGQLRVEAGNINLLSGNVVSGSLDWMKPATNQSDTVYSAGFGPLSTMIEGASYTPPAKGQLVGDFSPTSAGIPNASLLLEAGGLPEPFSQLLRIANPSATGTTNTAVPTLPNANGLTFTAFDAATGVFAGSFKQGVTGSVRTALFYGQLNRFGSSYGFFLLPQGTASNAAKLSGKLMVNGDVP